MLGPTSRPEPAAESCNPGNQSPPHLHCKRWDKVKGEASTACGKMLLRCHAILFHPSRVDVVCIVWNRVALLSQISPNRILCDHHLHHGNSSLAFPLHSRALLGVRSPVTTTGAMVGNRSNRSIPSCDRRRRGRWSPYRLFVHSEAAVTQIAVAVGQWSSEPIG
jgi:hypothetical protein